MKTCNFKECNKSSVVRGYCQNHYMKLRKSGALPLIHHHSTHKRAEDKKIIDLTQIHGYYLVELTKGYYATVDPQDIDLVKHYAWRYDHRGYALAHSTDKYGNDCGILMHVLIMQPEEGMHTHHINNRGLDNRRCNLKVMTPHEHISFHRKQQEKSKKNFNPTNEND